MKREEEYPSNIRGIQYLRAVAALMVVGHHSRHYFAAGDTWTDFGSRGVDIFFVISGFIMAHATNGYQAQFDQARQAGRFLLKRITRVVPLYWIALLWTAKRQLMAGESEINLLKDFTFLPHFHPVYQNSIFPALVPGWTINYEMFFYLLFALSMLWGRWRFTVLGLAIISLVILGAGAWATAPAIFYTRSILLEFLLGILLYVLLKCYKPPLRKSWFACMTAVGFALLAIHCSDDYRGYIHGPAAALIVGSTVLWAQGLRIGWLRSIGDASYSIYLFHLASFWIVATLLHRLGIEAPTPVALLVVFSSHLAIAIFAGLLIHRLIERPLLALLRRPWRSSAPSTR